MGISTYSNFTYGHTINVDNQTIDFSEGAGQLTGVIPIGSYSLEEFAPIVANTLNTKGGQEYTVVLNRTNRKLTISAVSNFELLPVTGTNVSSSAYSLIGFTTDRTGSNSYEADIASGFVYTPQNILQKFVDFQNNVKTVSASVRQTASGEVEVVSYGTVQFMKCMIMPITDYVPQLSIISNANAVGEYRAFMEYCITKAPIEFVEDSSNPSSFHKCLLESTKQSSSGVDFEVMENKKLFNWFESGQLTFRGLE